MWIMGNNLDKQFSSICVMALQQEEPTMLNWPLISELKIWFQHPGMFSIDDKHCSFAPEGPPVLGLENNSGICGNWASPVGTNTAKHTHNNIRAVFGDFLPMVLSKMDKLVVCVTNGLSVVLEDAYG